MGFALQHSLDKTVISGTRRYRMAGRSALRLSLQAGDQVQIANVDGVQGCELLYTTQLPVSVANRGLACGSFELLEEAGDVTRQLAAWGLDSSSPALAQAGLLDGASLLAGQTLLAHSAAELILVAAGRRMMVDEQLAPGELNVSHSSREFIDRLPEPLAAVVEDIHVPHSSARAYTVRAGQWIQVIDVQGKQCSDFIAFDLAAVEAAQRGDCSVHDIATLDAAATRTMMGHSLPLPGLHSRFYDQNLHSMLEVVQDTVGRHDSFLMACTPRYYEDAGYFGHPSCTTNFNLQLRDWGIPPRAGWPAINFFFNTAVSDCGAVSADEPWSRPGDYVLMRAQRDLLCVSSACPDEIDSANGWCPTDIHIRVYDADQKFPRSLAWRDLPEELPRMTRQTGFHSRTSALTSHFSEYKGFWLADEYSGWGATAEYLACRERVAMIDLTPLRKFEVLGPDAEALLQYAVTRNVRRLAIGEVTYTALCHSTGGMIDDGTLFRMGAQAFRLITGDSWVGTWLRQLASENGWQVRVQESTDQIHNVAVQGPDSRKLLSQLIWTAEHQPDLADLAWFHFLIGRLGGPTGVPLMVSRTGYTGELGFEVWCHPDHAAQVWDAIWQAGQAFEIAPMGLLALDRLRIEAGLIFAGHEFCPQTNPYEAGIGFTVPMKTKEEDFVGRAALARQAPESRQKLMGLVINSTQPVAHGDAVYQGRFPVGVITSATFSPLLKQQIALCRLAPDAAAPGTSLEVGQLDGLQKRIAATVTTTPFYDPERTRVRS
jgi:aminomethyltransferase